MESLIDLAFLSTLFVVALLAGFGLTRALGRPCSSPLEAFCFALGLGLGAIAYWLFLDGILALNVPWAGGCVLFFALARYGWDSARATLPALAQSVLRLGGVSLFCALLIALLSALALLGGLAPPIANDWDSLTYHLAIPKLYLQRGRMIYVPWSDHSNFPFTMEMLYGLGLRVSPVAGKLPHFLTFVLALASIALLGRRFFSRQAGLAGALVFASMPMAWHEATTGYVDVALAAYALLAFYCLLSWRSATGDRTSLAPLIGIFTGLTMGIKYSGLLIFALVIGWMIVHVMRSRKAARADPGPQPMTVLAVLALAALIASPWYVKNEINTGNPVYPFYYQVFGGRNWSRQLAEQYATAQKEFGYDRTPANFALSPWRASMWPWNFQADRPGFARWCFETAPIPPLLGMIGPTLLALLVPLLWLSNGLFESRRRADDESLALGVLVGSAGALFLAWFVLMQYNRYAFPCVALLSVVAGHSVALLSARHRLGQLAAWGALASSTVITLVLVARFHTASIRCALGQESRRDFLYRFELYPACEYLNQDTAPDAKVLLLGEERGFYLDREYMWGSPGHHRLLPYHRLRTARDWLREVRKLKVTHLLLNQKAIPAADRRWVDEGVAAGLFRERFNARGIAVYELTP